MNNLLAFHNDKKIKEKYVKRVKAHYKADEIIQGKYWEKGKGCAVGCTIENDDVKHSYGDWHQRYEEALGISRIIARLEDRIFEGLTNGEAKEFPLKFLEAINVGADLNLVFYQFMHWLLVDPETGVIKYAKDAKGKKAIQEVADLFRRKIDGEDIDFETWMNARRAVRAAYAADATAATADATYATADATADAAAYAADAYAADAYAATADAYAAAAAYAAAYAADAYAYAAAYAADAFRKSRSARFSQMAQKLIELLKAAE